MVTVDCFMHSYEADAVQVRLAELAGVVDLHVAIQATTTLRYEPRETPWIEHPGVVNLVVDLPPDLGPFQAEEFLRDASFTLAAEWVAGHRPSEPAWFIVADGDEIPHPAAVRAATAARHPRTLLTDYREWYMDWRAPDSWQLERQPIIGTAAQIRAQGGASRARRHCREWRTEAAVGWHLSTLGDGALASRKLSTFSHPEYDTPEWNEVTQLDRFRTAGRDLLDRFDLIPTRDLPACAAAFPHLLAPTEA
jgi:hypothetical protein